MESDNDLCVSMKKLTELATKYQRYFISVGVGASGWIMSRQFLMDFINSEYFQSPDDVVDERHGPDVYVAKWLRDTRQWSVTRQYLVQHTISSVASTTSQQQQSASQQQGLTINSDAIEFDFKHLPRCFEPHRGMWIRYSKESIPRDKYGWDYFDTKKCPNNEEEIFPCKDFHQIPIHRPLKLF